MQKFNSRVDEEAVTTLKWIFYPMIVVAGLYSGLAADEQTAAIAETLGHPILLFWLAMNVGCPIIALCGQTLYRRAAEKSEGEDNNAVGGAWFQLWGDTGVFGAISIAFVSWATTFTWGQPMYFTFFFLMGIPASALFSYRSWRRLRQIRRRTQGRQR